MKSIFSSFIAILLIQSVNAQNSIRPNTYLQDMQYYNPAAIAIDSSQHMQTSIYGKHKFVDNNDEVWNKPMNIWLSHTARIKQSNSFYTFSYINDSYSFFNRNAVYLGYVKQWKINHISSLNYGGRIVANMDVVNWDKFSLPHNESGKKGFFNPDIDLGATYQYKKLNVGIGFKNLFATEKKVEGATLLKNHREINVNLSYRQNIGSQFAITPFVLLAHERNTLIDAGLSFLLFKRCTASYALRINELKSVFVLDVNVFKGWSIGLGYDRSSLVSDNNFDFVLRYRR